MKKGFTLAEVLITLAIIGIVAAITIPSLMADVNQKAFDNQRKTLHSRLANALTAMDRLSGYGTFAKNDSGDITKDTAAETFLVDGLSKVYKIKNICTFEKKSKCGISDSFTGFNGDTVTYPASLVDLWGTYEAMSDWENASTNQQVAPMAFETNNGETILFYYNPLCVNKKSVGNDISAMCANFIYDLNGPKAPNMMGKDMGFITAFYKEDPIVVAPMIDDKSINAGEAKSTEAADKCAQVGDDYRLPTADELLAIYINSLDNNNPKNIDGLYNDYWSSDIVSAGGESGKAYRSWGGGYSAVNRSMTSKIICIKR